MKFIKISFYVLLGLALFLFLAFQFLIHQTKKNSPQARVLFEKKVNGNDLKIEVNYSRPFKKGRKIFGGLVPYDSVWRTGANEATVFETNQNLKIGGQVLQAGKYTLWTIPGPASWSVIFNKKDYFWGINGKRKASRDPKFDALRIEIPVENQNLVKEQFEINIKEDPNLKMTMAWDQVQVTVPMETI